MGSRRGLAAVCCVIVASAGVAQVPGSAVPGEVLVEFARGPNLTRWLTGRYIGGLKPAAVMGEDILRVRPGADPERMAEMLRQMPGVVSAEPNRYWAIAGAPSAPFEFEQWALHKIEAPYAWPISRGQGAVVAIVDTGVDSNHPDLAANLLPGRNFTSKQIADTMDRHGHGTHCAGIVAALAGNGFGVSGVSPGARILPVKVMGDNGVGKTDHIAAGIRWAADRGAKVISLSLGSSKPSSTLEKAVNYAWSRGAVVVAAAGNSGSTKYFYPAAYERAIAVAATDSMDQRASFSNFGPWVSLSAPGTGIMSTVPYGYQSWSGTSMATPHVAAAAAILFSALGTDTRPYDVRGRLELNSDPLVGIAAYGRLNAWAPLGHQGTAYARTEHQCASWGAGAGRARDPWLPKLYESDDERLQVYSSKVGSRSQIDAAATFTVRPPRAGGWLSLQIEASSSRAMPLSVWGLAAPGVWRPLGNIRLRGKDVESSFEITDVASFLNGEKLRIRLTTDHPKAHSVKIDCLVVRSADL